MRWWSRDSFDTDMKIEPGAPSSVCELCGPYESHFGQQFIVTCNSNKVVPILY